MYKGWNNRLDEQHDLESRSGVPSIWLSVEHALNTFGGWSPMFSKSSVTYDKEVIFTRESDIGFWIEYGKALALEQFNSAVINAYHEFKECYPGKKIKAPKLKALLAKALLEDGWKPVKAPIIREIRSLRKRKREEIKALRGGRTKKQWQAHLRALKEKNND